MSHIVIANMRMWTEAIERWTWKQNDGKISDTNKKNEGFYYGFLQ